MGAGVLSEETWENEPCRINKGWFPLPKPWPICPGPVQALRREAPPLAFYSNKVRDAT